MRSSAAKTRPNFSFLFPNINHSLVQSRPSVAAFNVPPKLPRLSVAASPAGISWLPNSAGDEYGGWGLVDDNTPHLHRKVKIEWRRIIIGGVGSSLGVLLATFACFSISGKGFRLCFSSPWHSLRMASSRSESEKRKATTSLTAVLETSQEHMDDASGADASASTKKVERVIVPVAVDTTQQEALALLKTLKIIEDDVRAEELCTRREYARWLFFTNSLLERSPNRRIVPAVALAGSSISAFDDVHAEDPDFEYIQALAEAGIIRSKLSSEDSQSDENDPGRIKFSPERFISRQELINWKAQVEYDHHQDIVEESRYQGQR